jgi:hypothetical protein
VFDVTLPAGSFRGSDGAWRFKADRVGDASAVVKASLELDSETGEMRARFKLQAVDLAEAASAGVLSLALLFGDHPGAAPCMSSGELFCESGTHKINCAAVP